MAGPLHCLRRLTTALDAELEAAETSRPYDGGGRERSAESSEAPVTDLNRCDSSSR